MTNETFLNATATIEKEMLRYGTQMCGSVIKIMIGPDQIEYSVHPSLLTQHSEYFKSALNGSWKESAERVIILDDVDCHTFEIFLEWLYTQQYPRDQCFGDKGQNRKKQLARIKACEFGDRFLAHAFRAVSESALVDDLVVANRAPYYDSIMYAHQHLRTNSPVLKAMVDAHCYGFIEQSDTERNGELKLRSQLPHEFLVNVMVRYMRLQLPLKKKPLHRCDYHGHTSSEDGGEKCKVPRIDDLKKDVAQKEQGGQ